MTTIEKLREILPTLQDKSFAQSLLDQYDRRGSLSDKQMYWVNKLAQGAQPRVEARIDLSKILLMFTQAKGRLKHPAIVIDGLRLSIAGPTSKAPGTVNVAGEGKFHERTWYGRINLNGLFTGSREATQEIVGTLQALADDPAGRAAEYGKRTGCCCFCNRPLTDDRSVAVGYGPTCADNFCLPWG